MTNYEQIVLGLFLQPESIEEKAKYIGELSAEHFDSLLHRIAFQIIRELISQRVNPDYVNVYQSGKNEDKNFTASFVSGLHASATVSFSQIQDYIKALKISAYKRNLNSALREGEMEIVDEVLPENLERSQHKIIADLSSIELEGRSSFVPLEELQERVFEQMNSPSKIEGYSWGLSKLDAYTSGIIVPRVYIIGGLKKGGKTRFMVNTLHSLHEQNVPSGIVELEVPPYEFTKLLIARFAEVNSEYLRNNSYLEEQDKYRLQNMNINWEMFGLECRAGLKIHQILNRIRRFANMGYKVIFLDFIQRIPHNPNRQAQDLEKYSAMLADAARINNVALIILSQYSNLYEKEKPTMAAFKGSGGIGEAGDHLILLDNYHRRDKEQPKDIMGVSIEQRYGDDGSFDLSMDLGKCIFKDGI